MEKVSDVFNYDNLEMWWEALDEYTMEEIQEFKYQSEEYLGMAKLLLVDLEDLKNDNTNGIRFKKNVPFNEIESLKPWIGDEIKRFNGEYEKIDDMSHLSLHRYMNPKMILVMLFASIEEGYDFVTTLTLKTKPNSNFFIIVLRKSKNELFVIQHVSYTLVKTFSLSLDTCLVTIVFQSV